MTKPTTISGPRRKLLRSITLGGGTVVAGQAMPRAWTRPVIESVVLPVHARTSGGQVSGPAPVDCPTLFISGITLSCDDLPPDQNTRYQVDDETGDCPELIEVDGVGPTQPYQLTVLQGASINGFVFSIIAVGETSTNFHETNCTTGESDNVGTFGGSFEAQSGEIWTASYSVTGDSNSLTVSDIVLQPPV